ncbi:MAG TPA: isopentenyl-diphosphate Delta-isomerase [Microbacteriaceae bacterium]|nr:isopentenyl-diphosphate Delta-isomerase [Microbacteriaceae bacterium]
MSTTESGERVVLLDDNGTPIGQALKAEVHTSETPLHLAFSCYVFNEHGEVLITRRALEKLTWPGVWTNSFCGHPGPGEEFVPALHRRAEQELGMTVSEVELALPDFRYRAVDASGVVENEICPVFVARAASEPAPHADEVAEFTWAPLDELVRTAESVPSLLSPWMVMQLPQLQDWLASR